MVKPSKPLAGYMRVSRKGDREELRSPDFQRQAMERYGQAEGYVIEFAEPEIDVSGSKAKRPILDGIVKRVEAGELGGIVVASLNRLSRLGPRDRVALFDAVEKPGGVVLSATEQLDPSTPEGRFAREVFLGVARMQWEKYREGFESAKEGAVERGIPVVTRPAVGLRQREAALPDGRKDRRLELDPVAAPVVHEVFERRAAGAGPTALAELLESKGILTSQGSATWSKQAIYNMLSNRIYLGELHYGRDDRYVNVKSHEPIVDLALWTAAQHPNGRNLATVGAGSAWLLTGLLRCSACRYCLQGTTTSRGKRIYRCTRRHAGGLCTAAVRMDAGRVEDAVVRAFWSVTRDLEATATVDQEGDLSDLEAALVRADRALGQWMSPEVQETIGDLGEYATGLRERRAGRDRAAEELGRARAVAPAGEVPPVETLRSAWGRMSTRDRRELLGLRIDCIALRRDPAGIVVYPAGTGPVDLPRRGFKAAPVLESFPDAPRGARVLAL